MEGVLGRIVSLIRLFPTTIGIFKNKDHTSHKTAIDRINEITAHEQQVIFKKMQQRGIKDMVVENFYQSKSNLHHDFTFEPIINFVKKKAFEYAIDCGFDINESKFYIADCWFNNSTGHVSTHTPHTHSNSFVSGVYYLSAPEGSGALYFMHPNMQVNTIDPDHKYQTVDNTTEFAVDPEEGLCVIFKSCTVHGVSSNCLNNERRISIAFNFNISNLGENSISSHYNGVPK